MQMPVLIERVEGAGFRVSGPGPLGIVVEDATRYGAIRAFRAELSKRLSNGTEYVMLDVPEMHPLLKMAGMFKDNPLFDEWQKAIEEERREMDEELNGS